MLLIAEEAVASISETAWCPVICSKTWLGCHRGFSPFQPFPDPRFLFLLRWCYVSNSREKPTASFRLSCRRLEMWNSRSNEVSVVGTGCWFFSHPYRFKLLPLSVLQNKEMVLASSDVFGFVKLCKKWLFEERTILQLAAFCAVLKVENIAGKETGSMPEHTFIYPILIPFPKAILRKLNLFAWLLGRKPMLEGIHLISLCHFPLQRSSLSFESLLLSYHWCFSPVVSLLELLGWCRAEPNLQLPPLSAARELLTPCPCFSFINTDSHRWPVWSPIPAWIWWGQTL